MIFKGQDIKKKATLGEMLTKKKSAKSVMGMLGKKYGSVADEGKYYDHGKSFTKYSLENDRKKTGKLAPSKKAWEKAPYRYDMPGIDTLGSKQAPLALPAGRNPGHKLVKVTTPQKTHYFVYRMLLL